MSLDFPAMGQALWSLSDRTGIRPEYALPVFWLESGFNPAAVNSIGCTGINQRCGTIPDGYASLSASAQVTSFVIPMFQGIVSSYGPIRSATRAYQANLLPASLGYARELGSVIARKGSSNPIPRGGGLTEGAVYSGNAGLDANKNGVLTVSDLASKMSQMLQASAVQSAISKTYALRPGARPVSNPVLGDDFGAWWQRIPPADLAIVALGTVAVAAGAVALIKPAWLRRI